MHLHDVEIKKKSVFCLCEQVRKGETERWSDQAGREIKNKRSRQWKVFEFYFTCAPTHIVLQTLRGKIVYSKSCSVPPFVSIIRSTTIGWCDQTVSACSLVYETSCLTQIPAQLLSRSATFFLELDIKGEKHFLFPKNKKKEGLTYDFI